jgi:hypothetical protein
MRDIMSQQYEPWNIRNELPVGDVTIGKGQHVRVYGFNDIEPPLVLVRGRVRPFEGDLRLTAGQAESLGRPQLAAMSVWPECAAHNSNKGRQS